MTVVDRFGVGPEMICKLIDREIIFHLFASFNLKGAI